MDHLCNVTHFRFCSLLDRPLVIVLNMAEPPIDLTLLLRAFSPETWYALGVSVILGSLWLGFLHFIGKLKKVHTGDCKTNVPSRSLTMTLLSRGCNQDHLDIAVDSVCDCRVILRRDLDQLLRYESIIAIYNLKRWTAGISNLETGFSCWK